jgi:hypothetical protein
MNKKNEGNVPAVMGENQFAIMVSDINELKNELAETLGGEKLNVNDLTRLTVPAGGGIRWTVPTLQGDQDMKELVGIIPFTTLNRAYWPEEFDGGGSPPACVSHDGLKGIGDPGGNCLTCKFAQFGSGKQGAGRGKACQESRLVFLITADEMLPIVIKAPATSLAAAKKYLTGMISRRKMLHSVYTKLSLIKKQNKDGIAYSQITFEMVGEVENPKASKAYADAIKPHLVVAAAEMAEAPRPVEEDVEPPM